MNSLTKRLATVAAATACFGLLTACGSSSDSEASPSGLPLEQVVTSVEVEVEVEAGAGAETTLIEVPSPTTSPVGSEIELTAEMFESMLDSDGGRAMLSGSIAAETGLDVEAASCLLDSIPTDVLVEAAGSFLGGTSDESEGFFPAEQMESLGPILEACDIASDALMP